MEGIIIVAVGFVAFILGLVMSPRTNIECKHNSVSEDPFNLYNIKSYREVSLERENISLKYETRQLSWEIEKLRKGESCMCCCKKEEKKEMEILKSVALAQTKAEDVVKELSKIKLSNQQSK